MAFPGGTSTTTTSGLQTTLDTYYDSLLIATLDPETRFYQFAQKRPLPQHAGDIAVWNRGLKLGLGYKLTEGSPVSSVKQISATNVSATILSFGDTVNISDLIQLAGVVDARKLATERLASQAAMTIDTVIKMGVLDAPGGTKVNSSVLTYVKGSTSAYFANSADVVATASVPRLQVSDIRACVFRLRGLNVPAFDGQSYIAIAHPNAVEDLIGDTKWEGFQQYTNNVEKVYNGEIGRLYGVRFVESTLAPISAGSANGVALSVAGVSTLAYGTVIFGKDFYGATEINGGIKTFLNEGSDKADPLDQVTIAGWKAHFISRVLNPSCGVVAWAGSGDTMTGCSTESARSAYLNIVFPAGW